MIIECVYDDKIKFKKNIFVVMNGIKLCKEYKL